jgi:hypothetical protein
VAKILLLHYLSQIAHQLIYGDELAGDALPDQRAILVDQEVIAVRDFVGVQRTVRADDLRIGIRQEHVLGIDEFFELGLRRSEISGDGNDFNAHIIEFLLVFTELGKFGDSAIGECSGKETQKHFLLPHEIFHSDCAGLSAKALRQLVIGRLFAEPRGVVGARYLKLGVACESQRQHNERQQPIHGFFHVAPLLYMVQIQ